MHITSQAQSPTATKQTTGISLLNDDVVNITYKFKLQSMEELNIPSLPNALASPSSLGVQQYQETMRQQATIQDTKALIRIGGEVVAIYSQDGSVTSRNNIQELIDQADNDLESLSNLLQETYGDDVSIETFEPGEGPTRAEAFALLNGLSFDEFINSQVNQMTADYQESLQLADAQQRQKLMYEQVPQSAVFRVGDTIVGSINQQGYVDINANVLAAADARGVDREAMKDFYSYQKMHDSDTQTIESMLRDVFGEEVNVEQFDEDSMPLLAEVRNQAKANALPF